MTTALRKPVVYDKSGNRLPIHPGTEVPATIEETLVEIEEVRRRFGRLLEQASVDRFLAEKRAAKSRGQ